MKQNDISHIIDSVSIIEKKIQEGKKILLAISGGIDSVVLAHILYSKSIPFTMAHVNFQLRGEESMRDEIFVKNLSHLYQVPLLIHTCNTKQYAHEHGCGIQEAARDIRYHWFHSLIYQTPPIYHYVLTAHHADDNIETAFFHFCRGTSIDGLRGILPIQQHIIRPLLFIWKEALLDYALQHQLTWVEDSSNATDEYTRNYIRLNILPLLAKEIPQIKKNILTTIQRCKEVEIIYKEKIEEIKKKWIIKEGEEIKIPIRAILKQKGYQVVLWDILKTFAFTSAQMVFVHQILESQMGKTVCSATHRVFTNKHHLIIALLDTSLSQHLLIEQVPMSIPFALGNITITKKMHSSHPSCIHHANPFVACLDSNDIVLPFMLRKWMPGDYFYPLGLNKKKKIKKFLIDLKLSQTDKEKIWVLCDANKRILWVVGKRISDKHKINTHTKEYYKIEIT